MRKTVPPESVGERIKRLRERADLSQEVLAERVGRSRNWIGPIEKGKAMPTDEDLAKIAAELGYEPDVFTMPVPSTGTQVLEEMAARAIALARDLGLVAREARRARSNPDEIDAAAVLADDLDSPQTKPGGSGE